MHSIFWSLLVNSLFIYVVKEWNCNGLNSSSKELLTGLVCSAMQLGIHMFQDLRS
jgi:hypothetical protein